GKTSTDIHMVMDILDTLQDYEHITEYIVLSGDADFTPVLNRLRARDKRTAVLSVGPAAAAYRAAADRVLAENDFVDVGLGMGVVPETGAPPAMPPAEFGDLRTDVIDTVREIVAAAPGPLALAQVAHQVRAKFNPQIDETDWAGVGTFKGLLLSANGLGLEMTAGAGGYIYDPARPERPPGAADDPIAAIPGELADVVRRICNVTGTPGLTAEQHAAVFGALADHLGAHPYAISETSKAVRDRCGERGQKISRQSINFILKGIAYRRGLSQGAPKDARSLAQVHADNVLGLADAAQLALTDEERAQARRWLTGNS
ncbi:MAG: NYN domain-containing protein, partial [Solirubrobacteraceae bacterium]